MFVGKCLVVGLVVVWLLIIELMWLNFILFMVFYWYVKVESVL